MVAVTKVQPLDDHVLRLEFSDGATGDVDCSFLMAKGLGAALSDPAVFRQARLDGELQTVVWPNGLDPAPDLLRSKLVVTRVSSAVA